MQRDGSRQLTEDAGCGKGLDTVLGIFFFKHKDAFWHGVS